MSTVVPQPSPQFVWVTCQVGAEPAVKWEVARRWPAWRFAYSRPGFLTFKLPAGEEVQADFALDSVFARAYGIALGKVGGETSEQLAAALWEAVGVLPVEALHVFPRDTDSPGRHDYEPGLTEQSEAARQAIVEHAPPELRERLARRATEAGELVLDCVLVDQGQWWIGQHRAARLTGRWPGGFCQLELPYAAVSRAWLKAEESIRWSRLPLRAGDHVVELGCAPGGSCQALLERGLRVTGVDPALIHPAVLAHPNFEHVRKRGSDMKRSEFRDIDWLLADMNVAPAYTLDTVENIVTNRQVNIRGLILTLKLVQWKLAEEIPDYLFRIRTWGYKHLRARQLHHNRQEICVAASREPLPG